MPRAVLALALLATTLLSLSGCRAHRPQRPSIVVIVVDDLGAHDLPAYGHPYHRTPAIDRLAREGLRFTRAYAASPVCAPTRAALLTGKSPARLRLTHALPPQPVPLAALPAADSGPRSQRLVEPQSATALDPEEVTLAERLRALGYRTALVGKWHLGAGASGPLAHGFELAIGGEDEAAPASFFAPYGLSRLAAAATGEHLTERLTDEALAFLEESAGEPFFLLLSHFAVHTPIQAPAERVAAWSAELAAGAAEGGGAGAAGGSSLAAAYAAMVESVDRSVERIAAKLDELGLARDTLVVLTSDNGGLLETPDTGEAVTANSPLRGGKATLWEGGLRVPLLVRWPAVIAGGGVSDRPTVTTDWFPTLLEVAGAGQPENGGGGEETELAGVLDGESLLLVLRGGANRRERTLYFHYPHYIPGYRHDPTVETWWNTPGAAIHRGQTKLIHRFGDGASELYDLAADPGESRNLVAERPELARTLAVELEQWLTAAGAHLPRPNRAYDPGAFQRELEGAVAALGGSSEWTPNGDCALDVRDGRLELECSSTPFVLGPEMALRGPLRVAVRFAASGTRGAPALWYRAVGKPSFSGDRIALAPGTDPRVREGRIAAGATVRQLRLDFGRAPGGSARVDWIRVFRDGESAPLVEWSFDG